MKKKVILFCLILAISLVTAKALLAGVRGQFIWGTVSFKMGSSPQLTSQMKNNIIDKAKSVPGVTDAEIKQTTNTLIIHCEGECTNSIIQDVKQKINDDVGIKLTKE